LRGLLISEGPTFEAYACVCIDTVYTCTEKNGIIEGTCSPIAYIIGGPSNTT
jgi:hypothetical protein